MQASPPTFFDKTMVANSCHTLLEYFQHPAWIRNLEGKYLWANNAFLKFFNVKEVLRKHCALTFRVNEKKYRATVYKTPILSDNNEIIAVAALMVDLTQELELENQLNSTKEFYHSVVANMGEALFFINKNTHFEIINKKAKERSSPD